MKGLELYSLKSKVAIVTGGASGIGRATAELFTALGAVVAIFDRDGDAARRTAAELGSEVDSFYRVDVTSEEQVTEAITRLVASRGCLDILVNCAGLAIREPAFDHSLQNWKMVFDVNVTGSFLCARHAARVMRTMGGGRIVNVASIMGLSGGGLYPNVSYQSSKGAVVNMTRALAVEWAEHNILVNAVAPTYVDTPLTHRLLSQKGMRERVKSLTPLGRLANAEEVAAAIAFLAGPAASMITGHILAVDGGFLAQ